VTVESDIYVTKHSKSFR